MPTIELTPTEASECAGWKNGSLRSSRGGFVSQTNQDRLLWTEIFSHLGRPGVYADVASNDYRYISNTYFFDRCADWDGVCVEPNPIYHDGLRTRRGCTLVPTCVSNSTDEVELILPVDRVMGGLGGVAKADLAWKYLGRTSSVRKAMRCEKLAEVFERLGHRHIDFMSLDVEGFEASVLRGIDFDAVRIDYILCESHCDEILPAHGYSILQLPGLARPLNTAGEQLWKLRGVTLPAALGGPTRIQRPVSVEPSPPQGMDPPAADRLQLSKWPIFVVTYLRAFDERRALMMQQLRPRGVVFIDASNETVAQNLDPRRDHHAWRYRAKTLGTWMSHLHVWRRVAEESPPGGGALVFEDDALLPPDFWPRFRNITRGLLPAPSGSCTIRPCSAGAPLGTAFFFGTCLNLTPDLHDNCRVYGDGPDVCIRVAAPRLPSYARPLSRCSHAYGIQRECAKALLDQLNKTALVDSPVDRWLNVALRRCLVLWTRASLAAQSCAGCAGHGG